ncbi:hypothetical protein PR003_g8816 [Phytophthora rubi]|uniref:CAP-Gly domain-containing protein n=1 Tax=Phytophthora rubi TaxID=129364 RepID=A0A6A4FWA1_9STRA|nr:hypothetical protein PR002_g8459 [Phytophthora rubi]KAE9343746.1 hypothetical protein PR003_g8816 [Phytophthora rubi]
MASSIPKPRASLTAAQGLSPVMRVPLGSRVVLSRRRNGTVRYVGKLANESGEWYGVALDEPKGDTDGTRGKERYFYCPTNHGVFVRRKEIYCVKEPGNILKGPPSPITDDSSSCSSSASTDQHGEGQVVATNSEVSTSPLMKTFKGFRRQLDFISLRTVGPGRSREASPSSSTPSSPSAKSGLRPPSPFRRFSSFTQEMPQPLSPGSKLTPDDRRRQSAIPLSPKPSAVRRINSFNSRPIDDSVGPASPASPNRFSSFRQPASTVHSTSENTPTTLTGEGIELLSPEPSLPPLIGESIDEIWPAVQESEGVLYSMQAPTVVTTEEHDGDLQVIKEEESTVSFSSQAESFTAAPGEKDTAEDNSSVVASTISSSNIVTMVSTEDSATEENSIVASLNEQPTVIRELSSVITEMICPGESPSSETLSIEVASRLVSVGRTSAFYVPPIDISAIPRPSDFDTARRSPAASPRESSTGCTRCSRHNSPTDAQAASTERTRSFRLERSSSFRVAASQGGSPRRSPTSSSENSLSRRSNSLLGLSFDHVDAFDDDSEDGQGSPIMPSPRDDVSEASAASAPEPRVRGMSLPISPRSRLEHTAVESISPDKKLVETDTGSGDRPLFFRRTNVGRSPMERRSSYSSFSTPSSSSPPKSPTSNSSTNAASRSTRVAELEREIVAMRSSHENIVAVLRATNKQHAANVLELRAQVAALTEGNLWLERQLTAKGELVRELREMEKQQQRDTVSVGEVEKILEIKDAQIQTLEREMAQLRQRLARLESDKDSQLYQQFQHYEARRERDEKRINELRKEVLAMCNERLELQSEVRDLKEMSLRFF